MPEALYREFPYLSDTIADIRLLGFPAMLNSFTAFTSSARANMFSSHIAQAMLIKGAAFPQCFSGVEYDLGQYEYNTARREQDAEILAVIPKYVATTSFGGSRIKNNPQLLVIYHGLDDHKLHYFTIDRYTKGTDGFGYENTWLNTQRLFPHAGGPPNVLLTKEVPLVTSPAHKGNQYCLGTDLNVAYMTMMDTIDDAMLVSESAAAKLETTEVATVIVNIHQDSRPVNLYGDSNELKFMPDIGEQVGPHGYLCALRPMVTETYSADLDPDALLTPRPEIDEITSIKKGATIVDIDFIFNPQRRNFGTFGAQMEKYNHGARIFWDAILDVWMAYKDRYRMSKSFSTLVHTAITRALMLNSSRRIPDLRLRSAKFEIEGVIRKQPVDFIQAVVTYTCPRPIDKAFKITDRQGGKGVVCRICPDDEMPVDAQGIRADVVIDPNSPVARMNFGSLYEPAINRISEFVRRECERRLATDPVAAVDALLSWYDDVHPSYGQQVRKTCATLDGLITHVREAVADKIYLHLPPFLKTLTPETGPENIDRWARKWNAEATPVTYSLHDRNGVKHTYTTRYPVLIGSKYIYCLSKLPYPTSNGISHISHYGIPIKPGGNVKNRFPIRMTAIRFGEDEIRVMLLDVPEDEVARLINLQSNSPRGMNVLVERLLTEEYPTRIRRMPITNEELSRSSAITGMFHHTTSVLGIETRDTLTMLEPPAGLRNDSAILGTNEIHLGSGFSDGSEGGDRSDERWLEYVTGDGADAEVADVILGDLEAIDEELGLSSTLAETGAELLFGSESDADDESLVDELEAARTEDDVDPLHDPDV